MLHDFQSDIDTIAHIAAVSSILDVVCETTGMGFAAVARVTEDRWIACGVRDQISFGLTPGGELPVETTICNEIRIRRKAVVIDHVATDPVFANHHTPLRYGFQSYISMPIILSDNTVWGTLCAIDPQPRNVNNPTVINMFRLFAELIGHHLKSSERLLLSERKLARERAASELKEHFIAVLGHDLRNPLASIDAGVHLLERTAADDKSRTIIAAVHGSVGRMARLIDNVLDLARGRLGGGITIDATGNYELGPLLEPVIDELRAAHPDRQVISYFEATEQIRCDPGRFQQLLSNLVGNALTHGSNAGPVTVRAHTTWGQFELSVANPGEPISRETMAGLFQPFVRSKNGNEQGLGLGLYISSEIAKAHRGRLAVTSTSQETTFTFKMPNGQSL